MNKQASMAKNKEQSLKASFQWLILLGQVSMDESFDWDSLTFSLTPTDTMYLTTAKADEPWMPGELRPTVTSPCPPLQASQLRTRPL